MRVAVKLGILGSSRPCTWWKRRPGMTTQPLAQETGAASASQALVADLCRRRLDTLIAGIANRDTYYQQIANAAEHISAEYQGRFLIELIQNANDQAVREGLTDSLVTITRTSQTIAVGNSGQPFDPAKVDAVTSIFKSDKAADECIGNKGIGFKAVFQVADSAEIFSSRPGGHLVDGCPTAFRMVRQPFQDTGFVAQLRSLAEGLLDQYPDRRQRIGQQFPDQAVIDIVMREAARAAWFTFPLASDHARFQDHVTELRLSADVLSTMQTLIVLPLREPERASDRFDRVIDEIRGDDGTAVGFPPAASFLFLPGIGRIDVVDHVRGFRATLRKSETAPVEPLPNGITLRRQRTRSERHDLLAPDATPHTRSQDWWVAERVVGADYPNGADQAAGERARLRESIRALRLPEENWKGVEQIPVAVALPVPSMFGDDRVAASLGANGRFCIGLPTLVPTGLPIWVSAHFHAKIDRTAVDFTSDYNGLLRDAAVSLVSSLIERLKGEPDRAHRRLATLAMERREGELARAVYADGGIAHSAIVLGNTDTFLTARSLTLPKAADLAMFEEIVREIAGLDVHGFCLPDHGLLLNARHILNGLAGSTEADDKLYLQRPSGKPSLLERTAIARRSSGPAFWEPFLTWVTRRFLQQHSELLNDQAILPTGKTDLAKPRSRVFFPPLGTIARQAESKEPARAVDDAGDELASIDENVAPLLRLFDDTTIRVRTGTARDYTPLAQTLAPSSGGGLVRRPRQADLINDALIPALRDAKGDNDRALSLLRQALVWLLGMPPKSKKGVSTDELLVPVRGQGEAWHWIEPETAYLGDGWDDDPSITLLTKAYGGRPDTQLVPWDRFERKTRHVLGECDRVWWLQQMKEIGVWASPRLLHAGRRVAVAQSDSYAYLTPGSASCPQGCPETLWRSYLVKISRRGANTKSGQAFYLDEVLWIDGLEREDVRSLVVEAVLRNAQRYEPSTATRLARWGGEDGSDVPALWAYALRNTSWPVIPTSAGLCQPDKAWFLPLELRSTKGDRFAFLPCVKPEFGASRNLLKALGIVTIDEADVARLVAALQDLASRLPDAQHETMRHITALATDLYEAIQARLTTAGALDSVKCVLDRAVPLLQGGQPRSANLKDLDRVLVDDDPIRRRHLDRFDDCWVIPTRFQHPYDELIDALRSLLGDNKVIRVSECPINVRFEALDQGQLLFDYIRNAFPDRPLAQEIALVIVKGGTQATSPYDESFDQTWDLVCRTRVIKGSFSAGSDLRACFDAQHEGGPALMVDSGLRAFEVIGELWQLVGTSYLDTWSAYADALRAGLTDAFFARKGVSAGERTEIEAVIGLGFEQQLQRYQPVCLALWQRANAGRSTDDFHTEWKLQARASGRARVWLAWDDVDGAIELARHQGEPEGSMGLLQKLGLTVGQWQRARRDLGVPAFRFEDSARAFETARNALAAHLMAWFAYLVVPRASGASGPTVASDLADDVLAWADQTRALPVPDEIAESPVTLAAAIVHVARRAAALGEAVPSLIAVTILLDPVHELGRAGPTGSVSLKLKDEPDKASITFERTTAATRQQHALEAVDALLKTAKALAIKYGEGLDEASVRAHALVALLSTGPWANRVSVLAAVRYVLETLAPKTAARMKEQQAFRDLDDWRSLWRKFEELGDIPRPPVIPAPKPKFEVLGSSWTEEEFGSSAAQGPVGELAQRLQDAVEPYLNLATLRSVARERPPVRGKKAGGGGGGTKKRAPEAYLKMLGAVGEHFIYQQLKAVLPDFDLTNWQSRAKEAFGYGEGDDSLGYDFDYHDLAGALAGGVTAPRCLIEVKSASQDFGDEFEMSTNEWETALHCHNRSEIATYMIIRVAGTSSKPRIIDILVDPIQMHLDGVLDYSNRNLLIAVGRPKGPG